MPVEIDLSEADGKYVVRVRGEVDLYTSPQLRNAVTKGVPASGHTVAIDLSQVAYMDSSGVATLVEGLRAAAQAQRSFCLVAPSSPVMKVLQLSRLNSVFEIRETV
ncbi:MAG: STAS domain-containing protein [Candidatus Hydrogenedentes bacterium]|nr:STAS domain-containing protein [Candidatus Hydrogenedentota bacterium]